MKNIETTIIIKAPIEKVWSIFTNFNEYPKWNPFIISVKGEVKVGHQIETTVQLEGMSEQVFKPQILEFGKNYRLRWLGKLGTKGIFDGEHYFQLKVIDSQKTELIHGENFSGILSGLLLKMIGEKTKNGFEAMNEALKIEVENNEY
jgi:hypothetical protein